jgi:hypothetical protein
MSRKTCELALTTFFRSASWSLSRVIYAIVAFLLNFRRVAPPRAFLSSRFSLTRTMANLPHLPQVPGTDPSRRVLDTFRVAIAQRLVNVFPQLSIDQAYSGVDYGKKGEDFTVAIPRFRLPGKVDALAAQVIEQVPHTPLPRVHIRSDSESTKVSSRPMNMSPASRQTSPSCTSSSPRLP